MFVEALIIGIIIGLMRHGKIYRLSYADFNMQLLVYISALLYTGIIIMNLGLMNFSSNLYTAFIVGSYIAMLTFIISNISKKYMFIPLIGICSNIICFLANNFKFPISSGNVAKYYGNEMLELLNNGKIKFFIPAENSNLFYLGNIIPINKLYSTTITSIGDIIISIGIILFVQEIISDKHIQNRSKITFSKNIFR